MTYTTDHTFALEAVQEAGAAVTFRPSGPGSYDASTDTWTYAEGITVSGHAVGVRGDSARYRSLGLTVERTTTILFVPTTYGELPLPGYTTTWGSADWTVRIVEPFSPDGTAIHARVTMDR